MAKPGIFSASGVILRRSIDAEGNLGIYLLLKGVGTLWVNAPGAARGKVRFGGATEPLVWGVFHLYKGISNCYLKEVDVKDDFWSLRCQPLLLRKGIKWAHLLSRYLLKGHPCDEVLPIFYWSLKLLMQGLAPDIAEWRFLWKWLSSWGLAPGLLRCAKCGAVLKDAWCMEGALLCPRCRGSKSVLYLSPSDMFLLQKATTLSGKQLMRFLKEQRSLRCPWSGCCDELVGLLEATK